MTASTHFGFGLFASLTFLFYIAFFGLVIYFMISAIMFFKRKTSNDEALINKIDELIRFNRKE
ncbi:hypothetical protein [Desulfitobacterium chlororespirans]|uniref:Uncharacterized protein n=1 Tax=Desulfitobacterium chlororespirans DSM 11544 TaxID=1121395 RepID=A0A1M7UZJ0_9FIRM|nr:hypothetical protein [Desulfitobacterium chlororespirans]SHN88423.1 hypothetical protein SAMN02745215_05326 [Desulfitobacterium chlororespirans DSM 11544]